ncbi:MAG: hypothetical protein AAF989_02475 [Planctomycetota bacterium]
MVGPQRQTVLVLKAVECRGLQYLWSILATGCVSSKPAWRPNEPLPIGWLQIVNDPVAAWAISPDPPIP